MDYLKLKALTKLAEKRPIHPIVLTKDNTELHILEGMSLREHYAGLAMQAILSRPEDHKARNISELAVAFADDLIKTLYPEDTHEI